MEPNKYRFLLWGFIGAMDTGKYDSLSVEEVHRHADVGNIQAFLLERFGSDLDLSLIEGQDWAFISETWASISNAIDERRKFGVENRGICLLMAYALESLQMLQSKK